MLALWRSNETGLALTIMGVWLSGSAGTASLHQGRRCHIGAYCSIVALLKLGVIQLIVGQVRFETLHG